MGLPLNAARGQYPLLPAPEERFRISREIAGPSIRSTPHHEAVVLDIAAMDFLRQDILGLPAIHLLDSSEKLLNLALDRIQQMDINWPAAL